MAKRLIDAEELKACVKNRLLNGAIISWLFRIIDTCSTVDAVEVCYCKNCKNWMYEAEDIGLCVADVPDIDGVQRYANDFCSYGERKDGGQAPQREDV